MSWHPAGIGKFANSHGPGPWIGKCPLLMGLRTPCTMVDSPFKSSACKYDIKSNIVANSAKNAEHTHSPETKKRRTDVKNVNISVFLE